MYVQFSSCFFVYHWFCFLTATERFVVLFMMKNTTGVTQFFLLGLTSDPELQVPLLIMFTLIYLATLIGNLGIIMLILLDSRLHTPMYFFLSNLSLFVTLRLSLPQSWLDSLQETRSSPTMRVRLRCSFSQPLPLWKITCWPQRLMTAMQLCANPYITPPP